MLDKLTHADFGPLLGSNFKLEAGSATLKLELIAAEATGASQVSAPRQPFSLLFRGPRTPLLVQQIYATETQFARHAGDLPRAHRSR